jgi:hypothetical protein
MPFSVGCGIPPPIRMLVWSTGAVFSTLNRPFQPVPNITHAAVCSNLIRAGLSLVDGSGRHRTVDYPLWPLHSPATASTLEAQRERLCSRKWGVLVSPKTNSPSRKTPKKGSDMLFGAGVPKRSYAGVPLAHIRQSRLVPESLRFGD